MLRPALQSAQFIEILDSVLSWCFRIPVVVIVITPPLSRDGGMARTAIQVHAVNLIIIRLGENGSPFRTSHE